MTTQKRLIFVNRYYWPDHSATSQLLTDLAVDLAAFGASVQVVTSRLNSDEPGRQFEPQEQVGGVVIHRVWTTQFGRQSLPGRAIDYLTFYVTSLVKLLQVVCAGDTLIAKTDPPLISVVCMVVAKVKGARLVNWIQDLFPELAGALGVRAATGIVGSALRRVRDQSLRFAEINVAIGDRMVQRLIAMGIPPERLTRIHNWTDECAVAPVPHAENPLRIAWDLEAKFVVGYSGNMGRAHEFDTILGAAEALRNERDIVFLLIGDGKHRQFLARTVRERGLPNILFRPYQPRSALRFSLGAADVHLVTLRPEMEGLVVPSKFYGIAAAGRATCFIGDPEGEVASMVSVYACGAVIKQGDVRHLAETLRHWAREEALPKAMGNQARLACLAHFSRGHARSQWRRELLQNVKLPQEGVVPSMR